jgi:hypothetical protein
MFKTPTTKKLYLNMFGSYKGAMVYTFKNWRGIRKQKASKLETTKVSNKMVDIYEM